MTETTAIAVTQPPAAVQPAAVPAPTSDWSAAFDADAKALVAAKGWRGPEDALKSYANLERLMGGDKIALPAADAAPEAWDAVYARLGRPPRADDYALEKPEGVAYSDDLAAGFREAAFAAGLSDGQARALHDFYVRTASEQAAADAARGAAASEELESELRRAWGSQFDANVARARRAVRAFAPPDAIDALSASLDSPTLLSLFARIGEAMGEDRLIGDGGVLLAVGPDQARSEIARIEGQMTDPRSPLMDRAHPEHDALIRRRDALYRLAFPG
jgi:hypothetical protein